MEVRAEWQFHIHHRRGHVHLRPLRPHIVDNTNLGSYFHDAVGNQTSRPDATVEYRAFDLPKQINWQNSDVTTFDYDGNRRRIRKTTGVVESIFMDDLYERVTNIQTSDVEHRYHVRSSERTVAVVTRSSAGKKTQFLHTDHLGSIDVVSNENGGVDERRSYDPFGARRNPEWGKPPGTLTAGTTFGFTGHLGDEELGLVYMRGRVYDPNLGRFLTADPFIANPLSGQNWNRYAYVANNPLKYTDPSGFTGEEAGAAPQLLDNNGNPVAAGGPLEVWVFGKKRETPEQAAELGALRDPGDLTTTGDRPAFQPDAPPNGSEEDTSDGLDIMLDVLGGASGAYANDVIDYAKGMVIFATFPPGYFMWQGYNFWGGIGGAAAKAYEQDGVFGAVAAALGQVGNAFVPLLDAKNALVGTIDAAGKGDYAKAGEDGYRVAKAIAQIAAVAIGGGIKLGGSRGGGGGGAGRGGNRLAPDSSAGGAHSTFKTNTHGKVSGYAEWRPNSRNPSGFDQVKRVDTQYANPHTDRGVPTPHVHEKSAPLEVRPARPDELPK
ncbi:MAG: hypothetical protein IPM54_17310 [Polyangiaceae bacterium]|nr:hypothetical protein [Polyangiaceae bacterium]